MHAPNEHYDWTPQEILHSIIDTNRIFREDEYTYIIMGQHGPTGKTWLCNALKAEGFNAIEITELIYDLVDYCDNKNHFRRDIINKRVVIVLNKLM